MKITSLQLRKIIREETSRILNESSSTFAEELANLIESNFEGVLYDVQAESWSDPRAQKRVLQMIQSDVQRALEILAQRG